jgi:hypothetical protein
MIDQQPNTAFVYLYRDAHNYKRWGRVVFRGECEPAYEGRLRAACHHSECFVAERVGVPTVFLFEEEGERRTAADHGWHEFWGVEATDEEPTDGAGRSIREFVEEFVEKCGRVSGQAVEPESGSRQD